MRAALAGRPEMREILAARDPATRARLAARLGSRVLLRLYPFYRVFEEGAATDPVLREAWRDCQRRRHADTGQFVRAVADAGGLRPGLTVERATDTLRALVGWHPVALLIEERGWAEEQLTEWLEDVLVALLT